MPFAPIAIVGRACLLPGAASPAELWDAVHAGRDCTSACPTDRWRLPKEQVLGIPGPGVRERSWHDRGGYVHGFEGAFDSTGFALDAATVRALDPLVQWVLHVARQALRDAGVAGSPRAGAVLGNLSLPSEGLTAWAETAFLGAQALLDGQAAALAGVPSVGPAQRFMSGLPAHLLAQALGLGAGAWALDAACASSLYAIKMACDRLHDGAADVMLAGAVNRADDLFLHAGFSTLQALSPSGRSRPFHRDADGLLPAEGCAFVVLKRLARAETDGDRILGVIRGIGLSNDGRASGLLVPDAAGQERAIREAYLQAGWQPGDVSLVECHATGTAVGDATEIESLGRVFAGRADVPIGSAKSNFGHAITVAGLAGVLKVLGAFEAGVRPPTLHVETPNAAIADSPFRLLTAPEPWPSEGPRRAAVSAFGFGGNNAHLLLEEHHPAQAAEPTAAPTGPIAIVALGARVGDGRDTRDFAQALFADAAVSPRAASVTLPLAGLRFPPSDLKQTLPQQLLVLAAAQEALAGLAPLPRERTGVFVGMGCDAAIARHGTRWRLPSWVEAWRRAGLALPDSWTQGAREGTSPVLEAQAVVGSLPNIVTNRLNAQFDLAGPSCSVSAEELSGLVALELAARALRAGELDAALVGAVDLSCEPAHAAAAAALLPADRRTPGDAAVVLVLKRLDDARREGDRVIAVLPDDASPDAPLRLGVAEGLQGLAARFGHAHAASGLLHVAAAALALHQRALPALGTQPAQPWLPTGAARTAEVVVEALGGACGQVRLVAADVAERPAFALPFLTIYAAADRRALERAVAEDRPNETGPVRLVIVADSSEERDRRRLAALAHLRGEGRLGEGVYLSERPLDGELAFVFPGGASAYAGMGRGLLLARPDLVERVAARAPRTTRLARWAYAPEPAPTPLEKLWGASMLCQAHAVLTREVLGLTPQAAIGMSSGETNALLALGAWNDMDDLAADFDAAGGFDHWLGGDFAALTQAGLAPGWTNWRVLAERTAVERVLATEPAVRLAIVNAPGDLVIAGPPEACERAIAALGPERALKLDYDVLAHCPELAPFADAWRRVHTRATRPVPGVRFYAHAVGGPYVPDDASAADMLTRQALTTIDFPALVERAYADGVRVFVEHGPQGGCTAWIRRILGDRPHLAVSLDLASEPGLRQVAQALAQLLAAGVALDHAALFPPPRAISETASLTIPAHAPPVAFPPVPAPRAQPAQPMAPAPGLPPVLDAPPVPRSAAVRLPAAVPAGAPTLATAVQMVQAHQAYLAQMAHAQARFIEVSRQSLAAALGGTLPAVVSLPASTPRPDTPPVATPTAAAPPAPEPIAIAKARTGPSEGLWYAPPPRPPEGPAFDRQELEVLASGSIASVFGPLFERQDGYARQVRMPMPPLLLADRVLGIAGEPGSMGLGTIWTETDVTWDAWFLHEGRLPPGLMIEAGQADLLLISYLGADFLNRGERVYRLLGCELIYYGAPPRAGETLRFEIHVDGHARQGDIRLFFFHYDCRVNGELRLSVRNGQAGFFTEGELAESGGVLWDPRDETPDPGARLDPPAVPLGRTRFDREQVRAFSEGRLAECFGAAYALAETHTRSPRIQNGPLCLLDEVTELDPTGGPWGRGYLRIETDVDPDAWFFAGHFKNDPCMPGTLMVEGCLQGMALYLTALGYTLDKDGWRFEPIPEEKYAMRCRGQVTPSSKRLVYEIFVREVHDGPTPTLYADLLGTVDGLKAFHCRRMGLRLVPDWPLERLPELLAAHAEPKPVATAGAHRFDYASLLACAWGRPSAAFGPAYAGFDNARRLPRLPGPPYHFISRVLRVEGELGAARVGMEAELEYDVPADAWYFDDNGCRRMPFAVLLEAALQPCGWLAVYSGVPLRADADLFFRNLDGTGTLFDDLAPGAGTLRTVTKLTSLSQSGGMTLVGFEVSCFLDDRPIYAMTTMFGFFPAKALESQVGLPPLESERAAIAAPSDFAVELAPRPPRYFEGSARMPSGQLLMLDRVTGYWPTGGKAGLGRLRAEKDVEPDAWFFKAHFYQDPVQPGSLGIEAMIQLLQFYMLERGCAVGLTNPRFETLLHERPLSWKYRGQVVPRNRTIVTELEVTELGVDARGPYAIAEAALWVDGKRIYTAKNLGMRLVADEPAGPTEREIVLDPAREPWLADHCPTYSVPALPLMHMAELIGEAARARRPNACVSGIEELQVQNWVLFSGPRRLRTEVSDEDAEGITIVLSADSEAGDSTRPHFEPVARARVRMAAGYAEPPAPWAPLEDAAPQADPYASGALFHGPAFQVLRALARGPVGASAQLDAGTRGVPVGLLQPVLLDGVTHALPNDAFECWAGPDAADTIAYPSRLVDLALYGPTPEAGTVGAEVRYAGMGETARTPRVRAQLLAAGRVWAEFTLEMRLFPKGPLGRAEPLARRAFLSTRVAVPGVGLSTYEDGETRLELSAIAGSNWFPGLLPAVYATSGERLAESIVLKEHAAAHFGVHPGALELTLAGETAEAWRPEAPLNRLPMRLTHASAALVARSTGAERLELDAIRAYWRQRLGREAPPVEGLFLGLAERFVSGVQLEDPDAWEAIRGRSVLYLANHQVGIESPLFSILISALSGVPTATLAKAEHQESWLGRLLRLAFAYPEVVDPALIVFFNRQDQASLLDILGEVGARLAAHTRSLLVHVEGTRALSCREPVRNLSAAFLDLAIARGMPIVPVRFVGGLPVEPAGSRLEFPWAYGRQQLVLGRPIAPEALSARPLGARKQLVLDRLAALAPAAEAPAPGDEEFMRRLVARLADGRLSETQAVLRLVLEENLPAGDPLLSLLSGETTADAPLDTPLDDWRRAVARYLSPGE